MWVAPWYIRDPEKESGNFSPFVIPHVYGSTPMETPLVILSVVTPMQTCTCITVVHIKKTKNDHHPHGPLKYLQQYERSIWSSWPELMGHQTLE